MKLDHEDKVIECLNQTYQVFKFILENIEAENKKLPMAIGAFKNPNSSEVCALLYLYSMES